jgi:predicted nuclease of predicted toxin-antitoxin system
MKLLADESVDFGIVKLLRVAGFDVISIAESNAGISDVDVLKIATENELLLITEDKDFGELTHRLKLKHFGVVLIRLSELNRTDRIALAAESIQKHYDELQNNFSVLVPTHIRIKKF